MAKQLPAERDNRRWLTLKDASDVLGIHYTTLRTWADNGDIPVFRTPGGHRRFQWAICAAFWKAGSARASFPLWTG